jgi:hypothetical protein
MPRLGLFDSFENHYYSRFPMTTEHNEFLPLSPTAQRFLLNVFHRIDISKPGWNRRIAAAAIRETVMQACTVSELLAIADNLHALPPEPPLKKQALDIWGQVEEGECLRPWRQWLE